MALVPHDYIFGGVVVARPPMDESHMFDGSAGAGVVLSAIVTPIPLDGWNESGEDFFSVLVFHLASSFVKMSIPSSWDCSKQKSQSITPSGRESCRYGSTFGRSCPQASQGCQESELVIGLYLVKNAVPDAVRPGRHADLDQFPAAVGIEAEKLAEGTETHRRQHPACPYILEIHGVFRFHAHLFPPYFGLTSKDIVCKAGAKYRHQ